MRLTSFKRLEARSTVDPALINFINGKIKAGVDIQKPRQVRLISLAGHRKAGSLRLRQERFHLLLGCESDSHTNDTVMFAFPVRLRILKRISIDEGPDSVLMHRTEFNMETAGRPRIDS